MNKGASAKRPSGGGGGGFAIGIYGVMAYSVAQRTQEIGIRLALGALPTEVLRMVMRQGMAPALAGIALGIAVALGASRGLGELLIDVSPLDPLTFASVPAFLFAVALFASWVPARRATTIDPPRRYGRSDEPDRGGVADEIKQVRVHLDHRRGALVGGEWGARWRGQRQHDLSLAKTRSEGCRRHMPVDWCVVDRASAREQSRLSRV